MKRKQLLMDYLRESEKAQSILKAVHGIDLTSTEIYGALIEHFELEIATEVLWKELREDEMVAILRSHKFDSSYIAGQVTFDESAIPPDILDYFEKAIIKAYGMQWTIHKHDKDVLFPSNPHAHNYALNLKLHLGTGELFRNRKFVSRLSKKHFFDIRDRITNQVKDLVLPPLMV